MTRIGDIPANRRVNGSDIQSSFLGNWGWTVAERSGTFMDGDSDEYILGVNNDEAARVNTNNAHADRAIYIDPDDLAIPNRNLQLRLSMSVGTNGAAYSHPVEAHLTAVSDVAGAADVGTYISGLGADIGSLAQINVAGTRSYHAFSGNCAPGTANHYVIRLVIFNAVPAAVCFTVVILLQARWA